MRRLLYQLARLLGDLTAVRTSNVSRRVARRAVGKATGRGLRKLLP